MRMEQLRCLVDIAQTGSLTSTAQRLFVSQQAISKSMKQLEKELGIEILVRTNMGVQITPEGQKVVEFAQTVLREEEKMAFAIQGEREKLQETTLLKICSTSAVTNIVLPDIIAKFSYVNINIIPRIYMVNTVQELFEHVEQGICDLGLLTYNEEELFRKFVQYQHNLDMDFLAQDELVVVMDQHMYQIGKDMLSVEDWHSHFCSMFSMTPVDDIAQDARANHVMCSNDADFHRAMIKKADAYVIMPKLAYRHFFSGKSYVTMPMERAKVSLLHAAVYRKDVQEELKRFASLVRLGLQE